MQGLEILNLVKSVFKSLFDHSARALRSTAPLYRVDDRNRRELFASGVFFRQHGRHFVLSAAHALIELRTRPVWVGGERTIVQLTGPFFHTGQPGQEDFADDAFDVGFVPLSPAQVTALTDVVYLSERTIEPGVTKRPGTHYMAAGFIAKDSRPTLGEATVEATGIIAVSAATSRYAERGVREDTHLLLSFDRRRTYSEGGQVTTPRIIGMSGCGIWHRGILPARDRVAAILTEHHDGGGTNFIVSTRLSVIIPALTAFVSLKVCGDTTG
jgi:hypothetical protein